MADSRGLLHAGRGDLTPIKQWLVENTNRPGYAGTMVGALDGADVYLGLSGGSVPESAIASMAEGCIVFSLANPIPEVDPEMAARHAAVVATGRSDLPNQINNVLAFPGSSAGAIDAGATAITEEMKLAAAEAIAGVVGDDLRAGLHRAQPAWTAGWRWPSPRPSPRAPGSRASPAEASVALDVDQLAQRVPHLDEVLRRPP